MRNLYCNVEALRKQVFAAVAKLAYEGGDYCSRMEKLPYEIIPGEVGTYRESIFLERAIVGERIRLAMGLPLRDVTEENMISDGVEASAISEKYYDPPLINIIKYACHACPDTHYEVTQACQGCLAKHCYQSCPKGAIELEHGRARIDQTKCIKCGRCKEACSYQAIIKFLRPCQERFPLFTSGKSWIFLCIGPEIFPLYPKPLAPGSAGGLFHMCSRMQQKGRSVGTVPFAYRRDIERYREKRDISFPSCAAASDRHPVRTPAYRSPTASADSHRRWRGYRAWWASPAAGACRAPREW